MGGDIPGERFEALGPPRLDGDDLLFLASTDAGRAGLWVRRGGAFERIVDYWAPVPGTWPEEFGVTFWDFEIEAGQVVFDANSLDQASQFGNRGIWYWDAEGGLQRIADRQVEPPGTPGGRYEDVESPTLDGEGGVVFGGRPTGQNFGALYRWSAGTTSRLANSGDLVPGVGTVGDFYQPPKARRGLLVTGIRFFNGPLPRIMAWTPSGLETLWSTGDSIPGAPPGSGLLATDSYPFASDDGPLVLGVQTTPFWQGIYPWRDGYWETVVDVGAVDPSSGLPYLSFTREISRDGGWTARRVKLSPAPSFALHAIGPSGEIVELARDGTELEGYPVAFAEAEGQWVSQGRAAFRTRGPLGDQIWIATLGEPPRRPSRCQQRALKPLRPWQAH